MKKKMMALLLSAVTVLSAATLTGCGQKASDGDSNSADGSSGQPVELTLSLWDEAQLPTIQENVDAFNAAHEGSIKVTVEQIPWDTYWTKLDASLETKEAPDVFWMNTYVKKYVDAGVLESLDSYIADENYDMSVYAQGRVDAFTVDGQEYALPKGLDSVAVALNTGLFEKYGVELPQDGWTWDDMRSVATELKDAIAAAGGSEYPIVMELDSQPSWMNFLYQNGGSYLSEDGKTCNVALPESKDAHSAGGGPDGQRPDGSLFRADGDQGHRPVHLRSGCHRVHRLLEVQRAGGQQSRTGGQRAADPDARHGCEQQDLHGRSGLRDGCQLPAQG